MVVAIHGLMYLRQYRRPQVVAVSNLEVSRSFDEMNSKSQMHVM